MNQINRSTNVDKFKLEYLDPKSLVDYELNSKKHPQEQIDALAREFEQVGFRVPIVIDSNGVIVQGHGRKLGAIKAGLEKVPVHRLPADIPPERVRAMRLFDNKIAETDQDAKLLREEIASLALLDVFEPAWTGYSVPEILDILPDDHNWATAYALDNPEKEEGERYTTKIESPIYTPKGEKPEPLELFDDTKASALADKIAAAELSDEVRLFLHVAAQRHVVFNYQKIAEFYAHAPKEIQELMEDSALVIIDFKKAIENGFVTMTKEIAEAYPNDEA
jgi:hypothetical protein